MLPAWPPISTQAAGTFGPRWPGGRRLSAFSRQRAESRWLLVTFWSTTADFSAFVISIGAVGQRIRGFAELGTLSGGSRKTGNGLVRDEVLAVNTDLPKIAVPRDRWRNKARHRFAGRSLYCIYCTQCTVHLQFRSRGRSKEFLGDALGRGRGAARKRLAPAGCPCAMRGKRSQTAGIPPWPEREVPARFRSPTGQSIMGPSKKSGMTR